MIMIMIMITLYNYHTEASSEDQVFMTRSS